MRGEPRARPRPPRLGRGGDASRHRLSGSRPSRCRAADAGAPTLATRTGGELEMLVPRPPRSRPGGDVGGPATMAAVGQVPPALGWPAIHVRGRIAGLTTANYCRGAHRRRRAPGVEHRPTGRSYHARRPHPSRPRTARRHATRQWTPGRPPHAQAAARLAGHAAHASRAHGTRPASPQTGRPTDTRPCSRVARAAAAPRRPPARPPLSARRAPRRTARRASGGPRYRRRHPRVTFSHGIHSALPAAGPGPSPGQATAPRAVPGGAAHRIPPDARTRAAQRTPRRPLPPHLPPPPGVTPRRQGPRSPPGRPATSGRPSQATGQGRPGVASEPTGPAPAPG
jgi:hypothetical protein